MPRWLPANDRFWLKVEQTDACWLWTGSKDKNGYGKFYNEGRHIRSHCYTYEFFKGPRNNLWVLHHCDNPPCVNPDHLFLGTAADNTKDMFRKKRANKAKGVKHGMAKLSETQVLAIRSKYLPKIYTIYHLAAEYAVTFQTIHDIIKRKSWTHI